MNSATYITQLVPDLLHKHNCVIVPGFGGFVANISPAYLQEERQTIHPASKRIAFNESLKENDGLLIHALAAKTGCSYDEANAIINAETDLLRKHLEHYRNFEFKNTGTFYLNAENNLLFVPYLGHNYLVSSFGLPAVKIRPMLQEQDLSKSKKSKRIKVDRSFTDKNLVPKRKIWPGIPNVAASLFLFGLLGFVLFEWNKAAKQSSDISSAQLWSINDLNINEPGDLSLVDELYPDVESTQAPAIDETPDLSDPLSAAHESVPQPENVPEPMSVDTKVLPTNVLMAEETESRTERKSALLVYSIVCFKSQNLNEAEAMKQRLISRAYDAGILSGEKANWHYVYAQRMYTRDAADRMASMIQKTEQLNTEIIEHIP